MPTNDTATVRKLWPWLGVAGSIGMGIASIAFAVGFKAGEVARLENEVQIHGRRITVLEDTLARVGAQNATDHEWIKMMLTRLDQRIK